MVDYFDVSTDVKQDGVSILVNRNLHSDGDKVNVSLVSESKFLLSDFR